MDHSFTTKKTLPAKSRGPDLTSLHPLIIQRPGAAKNGYESKVAAILDESWPAEHAQLALKVSHLEADVQQLRKRKEELERENEALAAAAAATPGLERQLTDLKGENQSLRTRKEELEREKEDLSNSGLTQKLAECEAAREKLEEECRQHLAESERRAELEKQQADVARSFAELQNVVSQLLPWLSELYEQRTRLLEEKSAAEEFWDFFFPKLESATKLKSELQRWRLLWTAPSTLVEDGTAARATRANHSPANGARRGPTRASSLSATKRAAEVYGRDLHRRPSPCRLRCRAEEETRVPSALAELEGELRRLAPGSGQKPNDTQIRELLALLKKASNGTDNEPPNEANRTEPTTLKGA
eukprot:symbB.v1.2.019709.t1/scaffold1571.1/size154223/3